MIQIHLIDKLNPQRATPAIYETDSRTKAAIFVRALKSSLLKDQWEPKMIKGEKI